MLGLFVCCLLFCGRLFAGDIPGIGLVVVLWFCCVVAFWLWLLSGWVYAVCFVFLVAFVGWLTYVRLVAVAVWLDCFGVCGYGLLCLAIVLLFMY